MVRIFRKGSTPPPPDSSSGRRWDFSTNYLAEEFELGDILDDDDNDYFDDDDEEKEEVVVEYEIPLPPELYINLNLLIMFYKPEYSTHHVSSQYCMITVRFIRIIMKA